MVLLRILRWLLRPVSRLLYALFALVWPRRRAEREEPLTQRGNTKQAVIEELQMVRNQLETKLEEKKKIENQLWDTENTVTALQEKVKQLQDMLKMDKGNSFIEAGPSNKENVTPAQTSPPPPPPPPPPPLPPPPPVLSTSPIDPLDALRNRKKSGSNSTNLKKPAQSVDVKTRAMDEMMERIKKGVVLKPTQKPPQDTIKQPGPQRIFLEEKEHPAPKAQVTSSSNWLAEIGKVPVLQRLKQNH
ncbi:shootin-1-like isoform X3 [Clarias gariepinus]|uniref:shootin-1-like isoform X3 n=1 Tax=Clarias gariepinus TaxID=13013 RepID=UPI00234CAE0E|nr:shootin-1-like isoform X3 [Clarias gariepinus]